MNRDDEKLRLAVNYYDKAGDDFIGIHWHDLFEDRDSLVVCAIQDRTKEKVPMRDALGHTHMVWPGISETKAILMIKTYTNRQRCSSNFAVIYRANRSPKLDAAVKDLVPEENWERV